MRTSTCGAKWRWACGAAVASCAAVTVITAMSARTAADNLPADLLMFDNPSGVHATFTTAGSFDLGNPFFQSLGTNGRACVTCHRPAQGWTVTPADLQMRFETTGGTDPVFATNDGSNCEGADTSTPEKRRAAFSLLLSKALIRVGMRVPDDAEFSIVDVDDPYHCGAAFSDASLYRRPLPATNLRFLSTVMWDGRETFAGRAVRDDLAHQALDATVGHAQGVPPSDEQLKEIVDFETALYTAQAQDRLAGSLTAAGATGGPQALATQPFCVGLNDPFGLLPAVPDACTSPSTGLNPTVFTIFQAWEDSVSPGRQAIARGEKIFDTRSFVIDKVAGLNAGRGDPLSTAIQGTCTTCHNTPNAGDHSIAMPLNIGVAAASRRTPDLPLYTLRNKTTGDTVQTTDPGRAMVTGKWADIGKFKGPILRGLAARAPYFHNGSAASLADVVDFYNTRFNMHLTAQERADLIAFLKAL